MNGRIYDPSIGRMMSVDPIVTQAGNAQTWNRYTYVRNNPLRYTDPSGFGEEGEYRLWGQVRFITLEKRGYTGHALGSALRRLKTM